jgi:hypothetical protein
VAQEISPFGARLVRVLPPAAAVESPAGVVGHLDVVGERIRARVDLLDAWRLRFPLLPPPPRRESLQELVQEARRRLREDRATADAAELAERLTLVGGLREALLP